MRPKLTYANVMSTLCFFLLLGGGAAYAASHLGKNTVGTKQLKKGSVTTAKIKKNAITGAKVKEQTLTGSDINLKKLGTVPSATHATSADSAMSLSPPEAVHVVGAAGQPPFEGGSKKYSAVGVQFPPLSFYKDYDGIVHIEGFAIVGASSSELVSIFTLPPGFRPADGTTMAFDVGDGVLVFGSDATFGSAAYNGNVVAEQGKIQNLNGITFRAEF